MVSQISHLSLKMQFEVYDVSSYHKGIFFFLIMGGADARLLYFLINSHCFSWRYFAHVVGATETGGHLLVSSGCVYLDWKIV